MDNKVYALSITRIADGGFLVMDGYRADRPGDYCGPRFASTSITEALKYCEQKLETDHQAGS